MIRNLSFFIIRLNKYLICISLALCFGLSPQAFPQEIEEQESIQDETITERRMNENQSDEREIVRMSDGWRSLEQEDPQSARQQFGRIANLNPYDGKPRVGIALSTLMAGNLVGAVGQMRIVLKNDPNALEQLMGRETLESAANRLINMFVEVDNPNSNHYFMLAVLHYLVGDIDQANLNLNNVTFDASTYPSIGIMKQLIRRVEEMEQYISQTENGTDVEEEIQLDQYFTPRYKSENPFLSELNITDTPEPQQRRQPQQPLQRDEELDRGADRLSLLRDPLARNLQEGRPLPEYRNPSRPDLETQPPYDINDAWRSLVEGDLKKALQIFQRFANAYPRDGRPEIGIALTIGVAGDLNRAMARMRHVLTTDPTAFEHMLGRQIHDPVVDQLREEYEDIDNKDSAQYFMLSVLEYLESDFQQAEHYITEVGYEGTAYSSLRNMKRLIARALDDADVLDNTDLEQP